MADLKRIADVIIGSWTIANPGAALPTGQGVLDRALKRVIEGGNFPEYVRKSLHFVPTTVGTRCAELRAVLVWAQAAEQTSDPNPSYMVTKPKGSHKAALGLLYDADVEEEDALRWGHALAEAIKTENQRLGEFQRA
jgi:hypothetical protein